MNTDTYITERGTEFEFGFELKDANYIIHILQQPSYNGRPDGGHDTHRLANGTGQTVCWTGALPTLAIAKNIAGLWADHTENYILTGEPFPNHES